MKDARTEAMALADEWITRSLNCNKRNVEATKEGDESMALAQSVRSATYLLCADEVRARFALPPKR